MKKYVFLFSVISLSILSSCIDVHKNKMQSFNSDSLNFQSCINILEKVDSCDSSYNSIYTKENTKFYQLSSKKEESILLVETEQSCGYTGSCGNRVLIIKNEQEIIFQNCAFIHHVANTTINGIYSFFLLWRSYNTGNRQVKVFWTGEKFETKMISSNDVPWSILLQLPWKNKAAYINSNFDVFALNNLEILEITIGKKNKKAILVTADTYLFNENYGSEYYNTYWLFSSENKEEYKLLNTFYEVQELKLTTTLSNEYYNIWINKYIGISPIAYFGEVEYVWQNGSYIPK